MSRPDGWSRASDEASLGIEARDLKARKRCTKPAELRMPLSCEATAGVPSAAGTVVMVPHSAPRDQRRDHVPWRREERGV